MFLLTERHSPLLILLLYSMYDTHVPYCQPTIFAIMPLVVYILNGAFSLAKSRFSITRLLWLSVRKTLKVLYNLGTLTPTWGALCNFDTDSHKLEIKSFLLNLKLDAYCIAYEKNLSQYACIISKC